MAPESKPSGRSARFRAATMWVLVVVILASAGVLVWLVTSRGEAAEVQQRRDTVMSQAEQFMLRKETFGPDQLDDQGSLTEYRESVSALLTPKLAESFDKEAEAAEALVKESQLESSADVYATAVEVLDADSAEVLVTGDTTFSFAEQEPRSAPFRYRITLVLIDGDWRIDDFEPLAQEAS